MAENSSYRKTLKEYWGYDSFRPLQEKIIWSIIDGKDTFALLPTGGGKSICYQVPAVTMQGICIVISPLISLMNDQIIDLNKRGIKALAINSFMRKREIDQTLDNAIYGNYKLLYVSPERLQSELFIERFKLMNISFIAVDEAHCISQWGYDFRPAYLDIHLLRKHHNVPILALTATATDKVALDIIKNLELNDVQKFKKSFSRENIFFKVIRAENKMKWVKDLALNQSGSGIIYVRNRRKCKEISDTINQEGIKCLYYHAGLEHNTRDQVQNAWMNNESKFIVATNAFGMGIDKADVRFVLHWDLPDSLEAFYQEAGRAGRDGKQSNSLILYNENDFIRLKENFEINFPPIDEIKEVYIKLANFYELAEGSGNLKSFPFHLNDFCLRFKTSRLKAYSCLKQLEQSGLISLSTGFYHPSMVQIKHGKRDLISFREEYPAYSELIGFLLRAYSGIIEQAVKIDETEIAKKTNSSEKEIKDKLIYLKKTKLISYEEKSNVPSLTFLTPRKIKENINLSEKNFTIRKKAHSDRLQAISNYINCEDECRTNVILNYFNEKVESPCGHCDLCLERSQRMSNDSKNLKKNIINSIGSEPISLNELEQLHSQFLTKDIQKCCRELCRSELLKLVENDKFVKI